MRPYLDYGDIIYDEAYNETETFRQTSESIQHYAYLALPRAIRGSLREHFYHEVGLKLLQC